MKFSDKKVTEIPLKNIWNNTGLFNAHRNNYLTRDEVKQLIRQGPVTFIIANIGERLIWVDPNKFYDLWKSEIKDHLVTNPDEIDPDKYPGYYAYLTSEWTSDYNGKLILLEKFH
jgi:ribosomal protein L19E